MARIRTVKPEFWEDETIGTLSRDARLLFISTFNMADDEGLLRWTVAYVKAQAFLYDEDLGALRVGELMTELTTAGVVFPYRGGKAQQQLGMIVNFHRHQRVNRPQPSKLPAPSLQSPEVRMMYARRDSFTCHLCGYHTNEKPAGTDGVAGLADLDFSPDHLTPRSSGGSDHPSNIRNSHVSCNKGRGDRPIGQFAMPLTVARALGVSDPMPKSVSHSLNGSVNDSVSDSRPEGNGEEWKGTGKREGSARGKPGTSQIPESWEPKPNHQEIAAEYGLDPEAEAAHFKEYFAAKGVRYKDWDKAYRLWLNKAKTYREERQTKQQLNDADGQTLRFMQRQAAGGNL